MDPVTAAGLGLSIAGVVGTIFDNVERIRKAYKAGQEIPMQIPAVLDTCKTMQQRLGQHPSQDMISD
jgi:hypothetical protein